MDVKPIKKLKLYGFNNLTKTLSFNMYDVCYAKSVKDRNGYIQYIDEQYNADRLTKILLEVTDIIGAQVLNIAKQDYDPQGASVTILIAEGDHELEVEADKEDTATPLLDKESVVAHLDKSHITVHTYPEIHPDDGICTFRADIDVSTCGQISPLKALNYLIGCFETDIMTMDYRVRGFTRDVQGKKVFIDHKITSIQNYISDDYKRDFQMIDVNVYQENIFHTKAMIKKFDLDNYLFGITKKELEQQEKKSIKSKIKKEMQEIFYGNNI